MTTPDNSQRVPLTINLGRVFLLAADLLYLKLLHATINLCSCGVPSATISRAVQRTEQRIMNVLLTTTPGAYRQPGAEIPQTHAVRNSTSRDAAGYTVAVSERSSASIHHVPIADGGVVVKNNTPNSPLMQVSSSICPALQMSQDFSDRSPDRSMDLVNTNSGSGALVLSGQAISSSEYTGNPRRSGSIGNSQSISSSGMDAMVSASQFSGIVNTPNFSSVSKQTFANESARASEPQVDNTPLDVEGLNRSRSVESYPGRFPASDGAGFSSLATASPQMRGRGTTSVRPFSEV
ncbi:hypothetical protein PHISP_06798 [Aspergillus sp. HF37]|nr:hypothetical protein PHISP_06798 [Aspergillus sp. HF37]